MNEREEFKAAHQHLDLVERPDAWGSPVFRASHVEASWRGWKARASLAASAGSEPVAWGIFDSQGFYEAAHDQESAERFCAHYNKRKGADPLKPYTAKPLYTHPSPPDGMAGWMPIDTAPKDGTEILLRSARGRVADGAWGQPDGWANPNCWVWPYINQEPIHWMPLPASEAKEL